MSKTPLRDEHVALGARMVQFAGWDMPIQYTSIIDEHMTVRSRSGAFDVSHMGDFIVRGKNAGLLMDEICTNDVGCQPVGRCVYSHILDENGRILDDTIVTNLGNDEFLMVPNAATTDKMREWVLRRAGKLEFHDISRDLATIAVQGPNAKDIVAQLTSADISGIKFFWSAFAELDGIHAEGSVPRTQLLRGRGKTSGKGIRAFLSRTGYTGEDGFEIVCENADAVAVWRAVLEKGKAAGIKPIGLGARDTLRLEKGLLLSGTDFDGAQTSVQTGPGWVIDWKHEFVVKKALERQIAGGSYRKLVGMVLKDRGIPRHGHEIIQNDEVVGSVTSGTLSPVLKKGIALGYVPLARAKVGTEVKVKIRETLVSAEIVKTPFVKRD